MLLMTSIRIFAITNKASSNNHKVNKTQLTIEKMKENRNFAVSKKASRIDHRHKNTQLRIEKIKETSLMKIFLSAYGVDIE